MNKIATLILFFSISAHTISAQVLTSEDSLSSGLVPGSQKTIVSGYGEAKLSIDLNAHDAEATLERAVLFVGHKFSNRISLFTELEVEDAMIVGGVSSNGEEKGEIAMEQAFVKFDINATTYLEAGLIIPRIGIINENHLPTTFNGVNRPMVEQLIIPSTWRGIGVALFGASHKVQGLNYSLSLTNGLNSGNFENGSGIKEGRQQGAMATGMGLTANGALLYYYKNFRFQLSSTTSGSTAVGKEMADSLHLSYGAFANPVFLNECNIQFRKAGIECKVLACMINIPDADNINNAYSNNTPAAMLGMYVEFGYNLLYKQKKENNKALILFGRAEYLDANKKIAENGTADNANKKIYLLGGLTYKPLKGIAIKCDYTQQMSGQQSSSGFEGSGSINIGLGYNF